MKNVQYKTLESKELQKVEKTWKKHQRENTGKILFSILLVFVVPLLPSRKRPDAIDPTSYLFAVAIMSFLVFQFYLVDHLSMGSKLKKDLKQKQKKGTPYIVSKKERYFSQNTFFALDEEADEQIAISEDDYHKLSKGDQIVIWTTECAELDLYYEIIPA